MRWVENKFAMKIYIKNKDSLDMVLLARGKYAISCYSCARFRKYIHCMGHDTIDIGRFWNLCDMWRFMI